MIEIEYDKDKFMVGMKGHSDVQKCAGVSALFGALALSLAKAYNEDMLTEHANISEEDGNCLVFCTPRDEYKECMQVIYSVIINGLTMISIKYPDDVRLIRVGERDSLSHVR